MEDSACVVPKTPQESSLERGVRRPNRMSLLLAAKTNLFSGGDSDFNFVSTPNTNEKRKNIGVCESPVEVNPINLVHQISDLQKALRMVTQELDCTKKLLEVETEKRRALEKSSSPTSILDPFMNQNAECDGKTHKIGFKILNGVKKMAVGINELQESIKLSLNMSGCIEEDEEDKIKSEKKSNCKEENIDNSSCNGTINGSQQSANTTRSTYPKQNAKQAQLNSFQNSIKNPSGISSAKKSSHAHNDNVFCGHGTPEWCKKLNNGDAIDVRDSNRKWYKAIIVDKKEGEQDCKIKVHFFGWHDDWDLWMDTELDLANLAPLGFHTGKNSFEKQNKIKEHNSDDNKSNTWDGKNNLTTSKDSKLQSQDDLNSHSPGGMEISLSPVGMAKTPSDYRSRSIRYV